MLIEVNRSGRYYWIEYSMTTHNSLSIKALARFVRSRMKSYIEHPILPWLRLLTEAATYNVTMFVCRGTGDGVG
jgi:hypothetical protein